MANSTDTLAQSAPGATTTPTDPGIVGQQTGTESSLSNWVGPYATEMLGRGQAISTQPYEAYTGPLTAGEAAPQTAAFQGIGNLVVPTADMGTFAPQEFTSDQAGRLMNPFLQQALDPQIAEARRQSEIQRIDNAGRLTQAGAFGGGRQAVMESELNRGLLDRLAGIQGTGFMSAYDRAAQQFNAEQQLGLQAQQAANTFGLAGLQKQQDLGAAQRAIEAEGIMADKKQFEEEQAFPYKQVQYMQSLLQGLPLAAQQYSYAQPSSLTNILKGSTAVQGLGEDILGTGGIGGLISGLFGGGQNAQAQAQAALLAVDPGATP
tara:strand:- start:2243 stop:3202 length:960 start_codon:yes stop_codon:yes gene_type:complete